MESSKINLTAHTSSSLAAIRRRIVGIDTKVPLLNGSQRQYIYLDNAASTPVLQEVLETVNQFMPWYSSVHRGSGLKSKIATKAYDDARQVVLDFFGGNEKEHVVIFGKNTTEAINKLSYRLGLRKEDIVLVGITEHHSNDLPWRRTATVKHIPADAEGNLLEDSLYSLLDKYKGRVKLAAISGGSNVTGHMPNIHGIARRMHEAGAQIFVDSAQLAPHRKVSIKGLDDPEHLDYIAVSAHKMYAPFGSGALIGRRDAFEEGDPELCGGGTINVVTKDRVEWAAPPDRDEAGSPNVVGAVAFAKALQCLTEIGMDEIADHEAKLTGYALEKLRSIRGVKLYGDKDPAKTASRLGVITLNVNGVYHSLAAAILSAEWGIGVRDGCFCAHPYVTHLLRMTPEEVKAFSSSMVRGNHSDIPGLVRISFGMYNTKEEVDTLVEALEHIAGGAYEGNYEQEKTTGEFKAVGWQPELGQFFKL